MKHLFLLLLTSSIWAQTYQVYPPTAYPALDSFFNTLNNGTRDVLGYGAKCDGSTDDSAALQAGINWVMANGGELTSPTGLTCVFNTPLYYNWTTASTNFFAPKRINLQGGTWSSAVGANKIPLTLNTSGAGHVTSSGTTVTWVDGDYFHQGLVGATITVNGTGLTVASVTNSKTLVTTGSSTNGSPVVYKTGNTSTNVRDVTIENGRFVDTGTANLAMIALGGSDPADSNYFGGVYLRNLWLNAVGGDGLDVVNVFESLADNVNMASTATTGYGFSFVSGNGSQTGEWILTRTSTRYFDRGYFLNGINSGSIFEMSFYQPIALQATEYGIYISNGDKINMFEPHTENNWNGNCNSGVDAQYPGLYFISGGTIVGAEGANDNPGTIGMTCATATYGQQSTLETYNISGASFTTNIIGGSVYQMNGAFAYINGSGGTTNLIGVPGYSDISSGAEYINTPGSALRQISYSANHTALWGEQNVQFLHPTADNAARTFTINSNANVAFPIGTKLTFVNQINTLTIAITSDTLQLAGSATTGSRTLAAGGIATALKITSTLWYISGFGLT